MRPPVEPDPVLYADSKEEASRRFLELANILAESIDYMPEDETPADTKFRAFLWDTMELCRKIADKIDPPQEDWPENVVPMSKGKRRR